MTVAQKVSVSLLVAVLLFAAFAALAFTGLFDLVEARFYNPSITKGLAREVSSDALATQDFVTELCSRFSAILDDEAVKRSFLPNQSAEDIFERSRLLGSLQEQVSGLQSVRFVDQGGKRIHFSTSRSDILRQDKLSVAYKNYGEPGDIAYESLSVSSGAPPRLYADTSGERLIFVFPFVDSFAIYKGSALFSVSIRAFSERLVAEGRLRVGEDLSLIADPIGLVSGFPRIGRPELGCFCIRPLERWSACPCSACRFRIGNFLCPGISPNKCRYKEN
ncbi:hypothetical protein MASR2M78_23450 [Treponema sp.]